jgi:hypothetical protein
MRVRVWGLVVVAWGCSSGTAPLAERAAPGASIAGSWSVWPYGVVYAGPTPATFQLSESGDSVTGAWQSGGLPPNPIVYAAVRGSYQRPGIVLVLTDTSGGSAVDTLTGVAQTSTTIVVAGTTYYTQ